MTERPRGVAWDGDEWAAWEDALQDYAIHLGRRTRFEQRAKRARDIMRRMENPPPASYYAIEDDENDGDEGSDRYESQSEDDESDTRMSDTVSESSEVHSDQEATPSPSDQASTKQDTPATSFDDVVSHPNSRNKPPQYDVTPYDLVMSKWITVRRPLAGVLALQGLLTGDMKEGYPRMLFKDAPVYKRCGEHLHNYKYEHCDICGDVTERDLCQPCNLCHKSRDGHCQCSICSFCGERDYQSLDLRYACYCFCGCPVFGANCCLKIDREM